MTMRDIYTYTSPDDPARPDDGLFGPGSVTWRLMDSRIMWVAAVRALLLQALHPRVIRGTLQNATAITEPVEAWARLRRTRKFVETCTFGTLAEAERAGRRVRKIHESLTATDPDGTPYRVDEPELLLWVHCGEVASIADVASRSGMAVGAADLDAFVGEQRRRAGLIGLDPGTAPASMAELDAYFEQIRPGLHACDEAKEALRLLFHPPVPEGNRDAEGGDAAVQRPGVRDAAALGPADVRQAGRPADRHRGDRRAPGRAPGVRPAEAVPGRHAGGPPGRMGRRKEVTFARSDRTSRRQVTWALPGWCG